MRPLSTVPDTSSLTSMQRCGQGDSAGPAGEGKTEPRLTTELLLLEYKNLSGEVSYSGYYFRIWDMGKTSPLLQI